ncbi:extracellular solute-binding protein [Streptomyces calidiresistens]|uniref:Extracellular solute-binding protein n=1 Tax=Streptomyces calidiresistens TaxID=1485586 RepID=A0A7W3T251_9ACTN|nr:extracellular solute-binding protein [Streptomyces calidiresistens]MBB0229544.1 extracellular solute-binding protein [Streptomyces calidiresistens]
MPKTSSAPSRRSFLASTAVAAAAGVGGVPLLTACGSGGNGGGGGGGEGRVTEEQARQILPTHRPSGMAVEPDIPSVDGSVPGYHRYIEVDDLGVSVPEPKGSGGELTAMTPLWGTPPRAGNEYWTTMDERVGLTVTWQTQDGNTYGEKLGTVLAGSDIPDLVCVPGWELRGQIPRAIEQRFADLGPHLSGDAVLDYPNLAAIPTPAWQASIFGGALRGLPMPQPVIGGVVPFYREDIFEANGWTPPGSLDEFLDFAEDITSARNRVWACDDFKWAAFVYFGVLPSRPQYWRREGDTLIHRNEEDAYLEALEWSRKLFEAGVVHPDSVAAQGDAQSRFAAGETLMLAQGEGMWHGLVSEQVTGGNPDFRINAMDFFSHDGGDPVIWAGNGANIWTFVNRNLSEDRIRDALELANLCAAPYGTYENRLRNYGIERTHYTVEDGVPVRTEQGTVEVQPETYVFIASPEAAVAHPDQPRVVEDKCGWHQRQMPHVREPLFYGRQIQEPDRFANLGDAFEDLEDDVTRGRASISDMQNAVAEWRRNGGDELREWYLELLEDEA